MLEIYWLIEGRDAKGILKYFDKIAPDREPEESRFNFPQYEVSKEVFSFHELLEILKRDSNEEYSLYWNNSGLINNLMLFFTMDGHIISGLGFRTSDVENNNVQTYIASIKQVFNNPNGYTTSLEAPPNNKVDFLALCKNRMSIT